MAIEFNDDLPVELDLYYETHKDSALIIEIPELNSELYYLYTEYNGSPATITWADDFMGRIVLWAEGHISPEDNKANYLEGAEI
jgi:hypothetical protein